MAKRRANGEGSLQKEKMVAGKGGIPQELILSQARPSSRMSWARPRQRSRKN